MILTNVNNYITLSFVPYPSFNGRVYEITINATINSNNIYTKPDTSYVFNIFVECVCACASLALTKITD